MKKEKDLRSQIGKHLEGGLAYTSIEGFIDNIPFDKVGIRPSKLPYSFYEVFYHITFAQKDILEYSISNHYEKSTWPDDYWPEQMAPDTEEEWEDLKAEFFEDRKYLKDHILNHESKLEQSVPNSEEHSLFREIMLVIEHNAYHTGQLLLIQRLLGVYDN